MTSDRAVAVVAPAKLTISLKVVARRPDGYHDIEAEMVALDLFDHLVIDPDGHGVDVVAQPHARAEHLSGGTDNLISRALIMAGRTARVRVKKQIPVGGGLGGGSADAAAVLRWAGVHDLDLAATLGGDVPFCLHGGRALVQGIGERVMPMAYEEREFVLLVPPFGVDTAAVYARWDQRGAERERKSEPPSGRLEEPNDLAEAAISVEPRLAAWRDMLGETTGRMPVLAGSGSTWFVEGSADELGVGGCSVLVLGRQEGRLIPVRTVPAGWPGPQPAGAPEE